MNNKRSVWNIFKKIAYICAIILAVFIVLAIALFISEIFFYILFFALYALGAFGAVLLWIKVMIKIFHYIERRNKEKKQ